MPVIETVGIVSKPNSEPAAQVVPKLLEWLQSRGIAVRMDEPTGGYAGRPGMPRGGCCCTASRRWPAARSRCA